MDGSNGTKDYCKKKLSGFNEVTAKNSYNTTGNKKKKILKWIIQKPNYVGTVKTNVG